VLALDGYLIKLLLEASLMLVNERMAIGDAPRTERGKTVLPAP
jgi:hypothetical protein